LNTSKVDNAPRSVVEAMACGLCVTSTDVGGVACFLDDGKDALLVSPDDPEAMANAVVRILSDSKLAESLSRNGRRKAESHDWSIVMPEWERLFQEVTKDG
jgi:glycosyltransferase involved in cell wall biosynthesis